MNSDQREKLIRKYMRSSKRVIVEELLGDLNLFVDDKNKEIEVLKKSLAAKDRAISDLKTQLKRADLMGIEVLDELTEKRLMVRALEELYVRVVERSRK